MSGLLRIWPDLAEVLQVGRSTAYDLVARGEIPTVKVSGRIVRVRPEDVEEFIESRKAVAGNGGSP